MLHQVGDAPGVMKYIHCSPRVDQVDALITWLSSSGLGHEMGGAALLGSSFESMYVCRR
jgi:hypothetical protein